MRHGTVASNTVAVNTPLLIIEFLPNTEMGGCPPLLVRRPPVPSETAAAALSPLFASLKEEAERAHVYVDWTDSKLIEKYERLFKSANREYEVIQAWRAYLRDPNHVKAYFFPERFDRYLRIARNPPAEKESALTEDHTGPSCPKCGNHRLLEYPEESLFSCLACFTWLSRGSGGALIATNPPPVDTSTLKLPWRKGA